MANQAFNPISCNCDCIEELTCEPGKIFDFDGCACVVDPNHTCPPMNKCNKYQIFNPKSCTCDCVSDGSDCDGPRDFWYTWSCDCVRQNCDPFICEAGEIFDPNPCTCVPDPNYKSDCKKNQIFNPKSGTCDCVSDGSDCDGPRDFWDTQSCDCRLKVCDQVTCEPGKIFDFDRCACVFDSNHMCPTRKCRKNQIFNPKSCNCDCASGSSDCDGQRAFWDTILFLKNLFSMQNCLSKNDY